MSIGTSFAGHRDIDNVLDSAYYSPLGQQRIDGGQIKTEHKPRYLEIVLAVDQLEAAIQRLEGMCNFMESGPGQGLKECEENCATPRPAPPVAIFIETYPKIISGLAERVDAARNKIGDILL